MTGRKGNYLAKHMLHHNITSFAAETEAPTDLKEVLIYIRDLELCKGAKNKTPKTLYYPWMLADTPFNLPIK